MSRPKTPPDILAAIRKARRLRPHSPFHLSFYKHVGILRHVASSFDGNHAEYVLVGHLGGEMWRSQKIDGRWRKPRKLPMRVQWAQ